MRVITLTLGAAGLVAIALVLLLAAWRESKGLTSPPSYSQPDPETFVFPETPQSRSGLPYEDVSFAVAPGQTLRGWLVPSADESDLVVVTLHGRSGDRRTHLKHLRMLHDLGAAVLLFDMRENGLSDGQGRGTGLAVREARDAVAAAREMHERGYDRIVVMGCSLGGSAAILAAAQEPLIDGVIAEASIARFEDFVGDYTRQRLRGRADWAGRMWGRFVVGLTRLRIGLDEYAAPADMIADISPRPVFLIHGGQDSVVKRSHAGLLHQKTGGQAEFWLIEDAGHCNGFETAGEIYQGRVAAFLGQFRTRDDATGSPSPETQPEQHQ